MQREVIKWLQGLSLSTPVHNPRRDLTNGVAVAEVVAFYCHARNESRRRGGGHPTLRFGCADSAEDRSGGGGDDAEDAAVTLNTRAIDFTATSSEAKRANWTEILRVLGALRCKTVTPQLVDAVLHLHATAAQAVLENLYEFFTRRTLAARTMDPVVVLEDGKGKKVGCGSGKKAAAHPVVKGNYFASSRDVALAVAVLHSTGEVADGDSAVAAAAGLPPIAAGEGLRCYLDPDEGVTGADNDEDHHHDDDDDGAAAATVRATAAALQTRLALTRNMELAAGPQALLAGRQRGARYDRPTAASLVRVACGDRYDVSLAPSTAAAAEDAQRVRERNAKIVAQHALIAKQYYPPAVPESRSPASLPPASGGGTGARATKGGATAAAAPTITTVLRGPFPAPAPRRGSGKARWRPPYAARSSRGVHREATRVPDGVKGGSGSMTHTLGAGSATASSSTGPRRIQVNTCPPSLRTALEHTGVSWQGDALADEKSVELFRNVDWRLAAGISQVLLDVLYARRELNPLLDRCRRESVLHCDEDALLQDLLSCVLAHRAELAAETLEACWEALGQHTSGIAASVSHRPGEYRYLIQLCGYAFTAGAAQVRLLHVTHPSRAHPDDDLASHGSGDALLAAEVAAGLTMVSPTPGATPRGGARRPSYAAAALARAGEAGPPTSRRTPTLIQRARLHDDDALNLGRVYVLLAEVGAALRDGRGSGPPAVSTDADVAVGEVPQLVMGRCFLPMAVRYILASGTPAAVEAVSRVMVRTLYPTHAGGVAGKDVATCTRELIEFVEGPLRQQLASQLTHPGASAGEGASPSSAAALHQRHGLVAYHVLSQLMRRQREQQRDIGHDEIGTEREHEGGDTDVASATRSAPSSGGSPGRGRRQARASLAAAMRLATDYALRLAEAHLPVDGMTEVEAAGALGVGFLLLAAPTASLESAPASDVAGGDAESAAEPTPAFMDLLRRAVVRPLIEQRAHASTEVAAWELRVLTLELLSLLSTRIALAWNASADDNMSGGDCDEPKSPEERHEKQAAVRAALRELESGSMACLNACVAAAAATTADTAAVDTRDPASFREQQLALGVVSRRLTPDLQPRLAARWLEVLTSLPPDVFHHCLLPHESTSLSLELDTSSGAGVRGAAPAAAATATTATTTPMATTHQSLADAPVSTVASSIGVLFGTVEPAYVLAPLNQFWNTSGVVHLVLGRLPSLSDAAVLTVVAAALISPQPLARQHRELARNLRVAEAAVGGGQAAGSAVDDDKDSGGGDDEVSLDEDRLACTLRDVVGVGRGRSADGRREDAAGVVRQKAGDEGGSPTAADVDGASFWRGVVRRLSSTLRRVLESHGRGGPAAEDDAETDEVEESVGGDAAGEDADVWETATAVLFALFRRCANPAEVAQTTAYRAEGVDTLQCLMEWMVEDVCEGEGSEADFS